MKSRSIPIAIIIAGLVIISAIACGPFLSDNYLGNGRETCVLRFEDTYFWNELHEIVEDEGLAPPEGAEGLRSDIDWPHEDGGEATMDQDLKDLEQASKEPGRGVSREAFELYKRARSQVSELRDDMERDRYGSWNRSKHKAEAKEIPDLPELAGVPDEFSEYLLGAEAYWCGDGHEAIRRWENVLGLPLAERQYRTVWAQYMVGKTHLRLLAEPEKGLEAFRKTLKLIEDGFPDTLSLKDDVPGWMARCWLEMDDDVKALHAYLEECRNEVEFGASAEFLSAQFVCAQAFRENHPVPLSVRIQDDLYCRVLAAWCTSGRGDRAKFLEALELSNRATPARGTEMLAMLYYREGKFDEAESLLPYCPPQNIYTDWVKAKLLLRKGKFEDAIVYLRRVAMSETYEGGNAQGEIGVIQMSRAEFIPALDAFLRCGRWEDACYVAERVLPLDDLVQYVDQHANDTELNEAAYYGPAAYDRLRYVTARRLAREGKLDKAREYYPRAGIDPGFSVSVPGDDILSVFDEYASNLKTGRNEMALPELRAEALFRAAKLARYYGMEMIGAEVDPDWTVYGGRHTNDKPKDARVYGKLPDYYLKPDENDEVAMKLVTATDKEKAFIEQHKFDPEKRFHYRYTAAELMYEAAMLMPKDSDLSARALVWAGIWLRYRDDEGAKKYYDALLEHCPNHPLTAKAREIKWFPEISHDDDTVKLSTRLPD